MTVFEDDVVSAFEVQASAILERVFRVDADSLRASQIEYDRC